MDLAFNNLERFICHKNPTNQPINTSFIFTRERNAYHNTDQLPRNCFRHRRHRPPEKLNSIYLLVSLLLQCTHIWTDSFTQTYLHSHFSVLTYKRNTVYSCSSQRKDYSHTIHPNKCMSQLVIWNYWCFFFQRCVFSYLISFFQWNSRNCFKRPNMKESSCYALWWSNSNTPNFDVWHKPG